MKNLILLALVALVALNDSSCEKVGRKCENDWERFGRNCYKYVAEPKSWAEAELHCISIGGNLASVHSLQTQIFLKNLSKRKAGSYLRTWIGGHDAPQDFIWLWSDGSKFDFTAWHTDEPNNAGWAEKCVEMNYGAELLWNDAHCNTQLYFVCEKTATFSSPDFRGD